MNEKNIVDRIAEQPWLDSIGDTLQPAVNNAYTSRGKRGTKVKNFLRGTWLGHPLHPILTDIPISAYTAAATLDGLEIIGAKGPTSSAGGYIAVGLIGATGAAVTGLTDWAELSTQKRRVGLVHGLLNTGATLCYACSLAMRVSKKSRRTGLAVGMVGYGLTLAAAYLGGQLVYRNDIGVDQPTEGDPLSDED